uniref:Uncharacterized protein n=1 Tax=Setaria italica TaxID=4555 RepID=K3ZK57_SETIT
MALLKYIKYLLIIMFDVSANALAGGLGAPTGVVIELPAVRVFNVSGNTFNSIHLVLAGAPNLTEYDLHGLIDVVALCGELPALRVLRHSMNKLSGAFPVGFGQCWSLAELSLDGNGIGSTPPDDLFGAASLQFLSLHTDAIFTAMRRR